MKYVDISILSLYLISTIAAVIHFLYYLDEKSIPYTVISGAVVLVLTILAIKQAKKVYKD